MNLIVKKEADNSFTFCESSDGVNYDGQKNGGTDIKLSFSDDNLNVTIIGGEVNSYKAGNLFYDNGSVIIRYTSVLNFISTLKSEGANTIGNVNIIGESAMAILSIDTKTPALGQALANASVPVVLPAAQITTLTPPTSVGISGTLPAFAATPTFNIGTAPSLSSIDTKLTSQATAANQATTNASLSSIDSKLTNVATTTLQTAGNTSLNNIDLDLGSTSDTAALSDTGTFSLIALVKRALQNWTTLLSKIPNQVSGRIPVLPSMGGGGNTFVTTSTTGTNWVTYPAQACKQLTLSNQSGATVEVRQDGAGVSLHIPTGVFYTFFGINDASQLSLKRVDSSNTPAYISARWEA